MSELRKLRRSVNRAMHNPGRPGGINRSPREIEKRRKGLALAQAEKKAATAGRRAARRQKDRR